MGDTLNLDLMEQADGILHNVFGYESFHKGQREVIENILNNRNTMAIFPTGGGKSICYQIPSLIFPSTTIVISPLISLMKDQVDSLLEKGIPATYISSTLTNHETDLRIQKIRDNKYKIVYVAPERLNSEAFLKAVRSIHVPFIAIDEAHCVSQWGHNFRPSYIKIKDFITALDNPVTAAFTATANKKVQRDIVDSLGLKKCRLFLASFDRPNLEFRIETPNDNDRFILDYVSKHSSDTGIIYAATRRNVETIFSYLLDNGIPTGMYHAGLSGEQRSHYQEDFITGEIPVIVATNAFGMGIDKRNVRYIIHYNMPKSIESYYQEAGRAGRDGKKSVCILLKNESDYKLNKFLINSNYPPLKTVEDLYKRIRRRKESGIPLNIIIKKNAPGYALMRSALSKILEYGYAEIRKGIVYVNLDEEFKLTQDEIDRHKGVEIGKLDAMQKYYEEKQCLRNYILKYFNERPKSENCCNCSNCLRGDVRYNDKLMDKLISYIFKKQ